MRKLTLSKAFAHILFREELHLTHIYSTVVVYGYSKAMARVRFPLGVLLISCQYLT